MSNLIELIKLAAAGGELCQVTQDLKAENARLKINLDLAQTDAITYKRCYDAATENSRYWFGKCHELGAKIAQANKERQQLNEQRNYKERKRKLRKKMRKRKFRPYEPELNIAQRYWKWCYYCPNVLLRVELDAWKAARTKWKDEHRVKTP